MPYFDEDTLNTLVREEIEKLDLTLTEDAVDIILRLFNTDGVIDSANQSIRVTKKSRRKAMYKKHDKKIRKNARSYITAIVHAHGHTPSSTKDIVKTITDHTLNPPKQLAARSRPYHKNAFPCKPRSGDDHHTPH